VPFLFIVELYIAGSNMKPFSVAMEKKEWFPFALYSSCIIFRIAINDIKALGSLCQVSDIVRF